MRWHCCPNQQNPNVTFGAAENLKSASVPALWISRPTASPKIRQCQFADVINIVSDQLGPKPSLTFTNEVKKSSLNRCFQLRVSGHLPPRLDILRVALASLLRVP